MNLSQAQERMDMTFSHETELHDKIEELSKLEQRLCGLSKQQDDILDPEEEADPIIETDTEKAERIAEFGTGDADDVKPYERREDDDSMITPANIR
jgi:hypothetical protein